MFAIDTGIPKVPVDLWDEVPEGPKSPIIDEITAGGTNFKRRRASKASDGTIKIDKIPQPHASYRDFEDRRVTFAEFVRRMIGPIAQNYLAGDMKDKLNIAVSLGFANKNLPLSEGGLDAILLPDRNNVLSKEWVITDWQELAPDDKSLIKAFRKELIAQGVPEENIGAIVFMNDTMGVAKDGYAAKQAQASDAELEVLDMGLVGGTGTNAAAGRFNTEGGHGTVTPNRVIDRMRKNLDLKAQDVELRTGGMYHPHLMIAALQLLSEDGVIPEAEAQHWITYVTEEVERNNEVLLDGLATGQTPSTPDIQFLAQEVHYIAAQWLGILAATGVTVMYGDRTGKPTAVILAEGSVLFKGAINASTRIKDVAEETASKLSGGRIQFWPAHSGNGPVTFAMLLAAGLLKSGSAPGNN